MWFEGVEHNNHKTVLRAAFEAAIANLIKDWTKLKINRLKEWVDTNVQQQANLLNKYQCPCLGNAYHKISKPDTLTCSRSGECQHEKKKTKGISVRTSKQPLKRELSDLKTKTTGKKERIFLHMCDSYGCYLWTRRRKIHHSFKETNLYCAYESKWVFMNFFSNRLPEASINRNPSISTPATSIFRCYSHRSSTSLRHLGD
ncbi:unnamed protein product [Lactuca saligna]|uniref:Uncharacterized protein n=1 Tax=Lactuca saligna TaxID=75948 RepID=A0AA35YJE4_LACSI|nr:unnamed protein product [Lactuca saligna]